LMQTRGKVLTARPVRDSIRDGDTLPSPAPETAAPWCEKSIKWQRLGAYHFRLEG